MDINLEYYRLFYVVGKCKSITRAAEELSLTQPAVSQAMKHLEEALGSPLFVRTAKGVHFTAEGEVLYSYVERGCECFLQGEHQLKQLQNLEQGEIRIGASDMTLQFFLLPYLESFHEKYPHIRITVTNAPTPETMTHLTDGKIDFGVISTPVKEQEKIRFTKVREIEDIFVAGRKFIDLKGKTLEYKQLETLPMMCLEGETSTRSYVEAFLAKRGVAISPEFELATSPMLVQFAVRSLGVASVVRDFAEEELKSKELFALSFSEPLPKRSFCIAQNERIAQSKAAGAFLKFLEQS